MHDYSEDKPELADIGGNHFVYGNKKEIEEYRTIRESGVPPRSVIIKGVNDTEEDLAKEKTDEAEIPAGEFILDTPLYDTGSKWYTVGSFFLAPIGLIAGAIFKKYRHIRNYKACKKGAVAGLITLGSILAIFGLGLLSSLINWG